MKEIREILSSYAKAQIDRKQCALATVVKVEGSSYRRPGARMLVTEDGMLTGAISGGCLEGDALRKALTAILQQKNKLVTYDTTDDDDAKFGVQLGCNGIVHILFEPIHNDNLNNPIELLRKISAQRQPAVLVTLFSLSGINQPGTSMLYTGLQQIVANENTSNDQLLEDTRRVFAEKDSQFKIYDLEGQTTDAFIEYINPPIALVIAGAGNDAQPLVEMANLLGWEITVADGRPAQVTQARFPKANHLVLANAEQLLNKVEIDDQTAFVLMTHNYNYDLELLGNLLKREVKYIGVLGPKKKLHRMYDDLKLDRYDDLNQVHGPVGLDIGAETAEEIALSIVSEIKAVFSGASAKLLKNKTTPIHNL
ncbi:XdhC family protein [Pedobacter sandarakinus]|uniref:XdhC family protein n=1 Tax=Pedobacter sandarakinus TaxID=353156 RepID=UPI0022485D18|nr:XdhC/CoxI family protein [Pedobacter sandarakinus]MCX2575297.1 XdhC family protein [Pedobacter sandarakinus]